MTGTARTRRNTDLHPDDRQHRADLFATITHIRCHRGITRRQAAHIMGVTVDTVAFFDQGRITNPSVELVQRQCWTVDQVFGIVLHDLPDVTNQPFVAVWYDLAGRASQRGDADRYDRAGMLATLIAAREALGVTQHEMSRRLGVHPSATCQFERETRRSLLGTYQRYARALGGHATFTLTPVHVVDQHVA